MIDYSESKLPKGPTRAALKVARDRLLVQLDEAESVKVRLRSEGRCEVRVERDGRGVRCDRTARHVHHMIGGRGSRARGVSLLREHKQHVCAECHRLITGIVGGKKLIRVGEAVPLWNDRYRKAT